MAPSVSTGDGGRNVAGEYLVAEPLDYFHFAEAPVWGLRVGVTARSRNKTCCLGEGNRRGTSIETERQRLRAGNGEGAAGYAIEAVKIPLSGSVAGFAGDIGVVLTRQDISTNLQCGPC